MFILRDLSSWTPEQWDAAIAPFELTRFSHGSGWLDFLEATGRGRVLRLAIEEHGITRGYFAATLLRKGPFRILGSPLSGSLTEHLGPTGPPDFPVEDFLHALDRFCGAQRIHQVELGSPILSPALMKAHGYDVVEWKTLEVALQSEPGRRWSALRGAARNRIRRAERSGLVARLATGPEFVSRHHVLVQETFRRQGLPAPVRLEELEAVRTRLAPRDQVFTVEVRHLASETPVASGIFPHDQDLVYSLSTASSEQGRQWCASDLLHWTVIELAAERGLTRYRMGDNYRTPASGGRFKEKFGGVPKPVYRYVRHYSALARHSRRVFVALRRLRQRSGRA